MNDRDYAIVVGISKYGSLRPQLDGPEKDAGEFDAWVRSPTGGAVPGSNSTLIRSSDYAQANSSQQDPFLYEPTLIRVTAAFARLISLTVANSGRAPRVGRRLYIYLSGHGITPRVDPTTSTNQSGLLMANCREAVVYDHIAGQVYAEWFRLSHAFDEILLFMDCCRTDMSDVSLTAILPPIVGGGRIDEVQMFCAWATQWDSRAYELPLGNPPEKRGVFTYALMEALKDGPPDAQGHLTPKGIVGHLAIRVPQLRNGDGSQHPQFFPPDPDGRIVIVAQAQVPAARNVTLTFAAPLIGKDAQLQDGFFAPVDVHTVDAAPWTLALKPGTYVVHIDGRDMSFSVRPGETKEQHIV